MELENKNDKIIAFSWEPKGHRFGVIHCDNTNTNSNPRPDISFYSMRSAHNTGRVSKLTTLKGKQANALFWSPSGCFIILAGLKGFHGRLEFYDVDELETMATAEHFMATDIEWDPTGGYVATAVTSVHETENAGSNIWSFNGKLLYRILKDHFFQVKSREKKNEVDVLINMFGISLLITCSLLYVVLMAPKATIIPQSSEREGEIAKNLKKFSIKHEAEDHDLSMFLSEQDRQTRKVLKEGWDKWVANWKGLHEEEKLERPKLRDGEASDEEEYEAKEVLEVEEVLEVLEEVVSFEDCTL